MAWWVWYSEPGISVIQNENAIMRHKVIIQRARSPDSGFRAQIEDLLLGRLLANHSLKGKHVLLKPNLLKAGEPMAVTSPGMILAVSRALKVGGANVLLADSPAFGRAIQVIKGLGIRDELEDIGVEVRSLGHARKVDVGEGIAVGVSRTALDADLIVNLPRLKAHSQMGITCAVKNLYGTVVGFRKACYHVLHGGSRERFSGMILGLMDVLPKCVTILDAICAMHVTGPSGGEPIEMNFIAGSCSPVALDTAVYVMVGALPRDAPLWQVAMDRGVSGAWLEEIEFPELLPHDIPEGRMFRLPQALAPIRFSPTRFVKGRARSFFRHFKQ